MLKKTILTLPLAAFGLAQMASAAVTVSSTAPSVDLLVNNDSGGTYSRLFDEDNSTNHARGNGFSLGTGTDATFTTYEISAITISKNGDQTFDSDTMTLRIYQGTTAQFDTGTGHTTATNGSDYYVGTTVTPLYTEAFTIDGLISNGDYVTFELATPITVTENSDFGFFFTYDESAASSPDYFQYNEGGYNATYGGRTSISTTAHITTTSRTTRFIIQGTEVVPEPSAALLGAFGMLGLLRRRR
ncbi:MAG: PEP-CTERM sorting domain-containing protein [Verrucomicrobiota bacterium JB025]|nr:PEP-CTERM sorting domain-containing protein [Verrucomicrobiota bacterium JB025]